MGVDARILAIAERQANVITRAQLIAMGLTPRQIGYRLQTGLLIGAHPGVYVTAGSISDLRQRAVGACFAAGDGAVASHLTAAALHRLVEAKEGPIEITVPARARIRLPGIVAHRTDTLDPRDRAVIEPVPVTSVARTLVDIAGRLTPDRLESVTEEAFRRRLVSPQRLHAEVRRPMFANRKGIATLAEIASAREDGRSESELETKLFQLLRRYRLPLPIRQHAVTVGNRSVRFDLAFVEQRIAIELDGWAPHYGLERWDDDHRRQNATEIAGWRVLRFTWRQVTTDPLYVALTVADALGIRPVRWSAAGRVIRS